jgi:serine protease Do
MHGWLRLGIAMIGVVVFAAGGSGSEKVMFPRKSPVVIAVQKTRDSIVTVQGARTGLIPRVGSGVVVQEGGIVVTNFHVVGAAQSVLVRLSDGSQVKAKVLATEKAWDLAILKLDTDKKLKPLSLGTIDDLMVGETVIAIGNPFGYTNSVSTGIISALNREIALPTGEVLTGLIQTDASINPGNSGGALLNINGELIGINAALRDGARGIAFALNAGTVKMVLQKHLRGDHTQADETSSLRKKRGGGETKSVSVDLHQK